MAEDDMRIAVEQMGMDIADIRRKIAVICETWKTWKEVRCDDSKGILDQHCVKISDLEINQAKIATRSAIITGLIIGLLNAGMLLVAVMEFKSG